MSKNKYPVEKSEKAWKRLSEYYILGRKAQSPLLGNFNDHYERNLSVKVVDPPHESDSKFDSHCGWPSYDQSIEGSLELIPDHQGGMLRTEIVCANCRTSRSCF